MSYRETRSSRLLRDRERHEITTGVAPTAIKPASTASTAPGGSNTSAAASLKARAALTGDARAGKAASSTMMAGTSSRIGGGLSVKNANQAAGASSSRTMGRGEEFDDITNKEDHQRSSRSGSASASQQDDTAKDGASKLSTRRAEAAAAILARRRAAGLVKPSSTKTTSTTSSTTSTAAVGANRIGRTAARTTMQAGASTASAGTTSTVMSNASRIARVRDRVAGASTTNAGASNAGMTARVRTGVSTARPATNAVPQENRRTIKRQASGTLSTVETTVEGSSAATRVVKKIKVEPGHAAATVTEEARSSARSAGGVLTERSSSANANNRGIAEHAAAEQAAPAYYDLGPYSGSPAHEAVRHREMGEPKDSGWVNLDADDGDDPLMVSEYVNEVFDYLKALEVKSMPNADYVAHQSEITWEHRSTLVDWLIDTHQKFRLVPETLYLAVNILDRLLSFRHVAIGKLQLVGCTALFIAAKYEEVMCPSVQNFHYLSDSTFSENEILAAERYVLRTLSFNLSYPNPMNFLRRISKADDYDIQTRTVAKFFMEISTVDYRLIGHPPSVIAAAAVWLAREALDRGPWTATLTHYSSFALDELLTTAEIMVDYCLRPCRHPIFQKKYGAKKFMKACTYVLDWAKGKYPGCAEIGEPRDPTHCCVDLFEEYGFTRPSPERLQVFFGFAESRPTAAEMDISAEMRADRLSDEEGFDAEEEEEMYSDEEREYSQE